MSKGTSKGKGKGKQPAKPLPASGKRAKPAPLRPTKRSGSRARAEAPPSVEPPEKPDSRRTTYADDPDKSFRFTRERRAAFLLLLRAMVPHARACELVACAEETPRDWHRAGRLLIDAMEQGPPSVLDARQREQVEFARQYEDALTLAEANLVGRVQAGAVHDWKAAAWLLSVKKPADYSERWKVRKLQVDADEPVREAERRAKGLQGDLLEEKLTTMREIRKNGGQILVVGADDLIAALVTADDLPPEVRDPLLVWLNEKGFRFVEARDLGAEPDGMGATT